MRHHEYAGLFPMLPDPELQSLANDIRQNGLETPITTLDGAILDGRNRHRACEIAEVPPRFEEYSGKDPMQFVISHNLHRRHLTESQRGMAAALVANMKQGGDRAKPSIDGFKSASLAMREAGEMLNVGESTVTRAKKIRKLGAPELVAAVEAGQVTVGAAYKVAELDHDQQRELVASGPSAVRKASKSTNKHDLTISATTEEKSKVGPYIPSDGLAIWATAKSVLNRIHANDTERKAALVAAKQYIETRLENDQ